MDKCIVCGVEHTRVVGNTASLYCDKHAKVCDMVCFSLEKRFFVNRGPNVSIETLMNNVKLADGRLVENHALSDTNAFPERLRTLPDLPSNEV